MLLMILCAVSPIACMDIKCRIRDLTKLTPLELGVVLDSLEHQRRGVEKDREAHIKKFLKLIESNPSAKQAYEEAYLKALSKL